jgi:hypothetical protein
MKNSFIEIDRTSHHPIVIGTLSDKEPTSKDLAEYFGWLDEILRTETRFAFLIDPRKAKYMDSQTRITIGKWMKDNESSLKGKMVCKMYVISTIMHRGIFRGLTLMQKPIIPTEAYADIESAIEACREYLKKALHLKI